MLDNNTAWLKMSKYSIYRNLLEKNGVVDI